MGGADLMEEGKMDGVLTVAGAGGGHGGFRGGWERPELQRGVSLQ